MVNEHDIKDLWPQGVQNPYREELQYKAQISGYNQRLEKDPNGRSPKEPGAKLDSGKSPVWQGLLDYFPRACKAVAEVSSAGATKYAWKGWETVPDGVVRYRNAQARHILDESVDGKYDQDGFRHLAQNAWNALAALELTLRSEQNEVK
jgi:hypothetical protein